MTIWQAEVASLKLLRALAGTQMPLSYSLRADPWPATSYLAPDSE